MVLFKCLRANREDDGKWPKKNKDGRQELEIKIATEHIVFEVGSSTYSLLRRLI